VTAFATPGDASTSLYWDVDGIPLSTYAYAIKTYGASRLAPPPLRGDNRKIPFAPGMKFLPKVPDQRTVTLDMWVIGALPDGTVVDEVQFDYNWRMLRNLLWRPQEEFVLTKRFTTDAAGTVVQASGLAQFSTGLNPEMTGRMRADFSVDLIMADPFFYSDPVEIDFGPLPATSLSQSFNVDGDWSTRAILLHVDGPVTSPIWTYETPTPDQWCRFNTDVPDGGSCDIDVVNFSATLTNGGPASPATGYMQRSGGFFWLELQPGPAVVSFSAASGTGTSTLTYQPVWL